MLATNIVEFWLHLPTHSMVQRLVTKWWNLQTPTKNQNFPPSQFVSLLTQGVEFTPTGDTRFQETELPFAFFEIYEPLLARTESVEVPLEMKLTNLKTGKLAVGTGLRPVVSEIRPGNPVIPVVFAQETLRELSELEYFNSEHKRQQSLRYISPGSASIRFGRE
jgi:hypothetical protein